MRLLFCCVGHLKRSLSTMERQLKITKFHQYNTSRVLVDCTLIKGDGTDDDGTPCVQACLKLRKKSSGTTVKVVKLDISRPKKVVKIDGKTNISKLDCVALNHDNKLLSQDLMDFQRRTEESRRTCRE